MQFSKDKIRLIKSYLAGENARFTLFYAISGLFILLNAYMVYRNAYYTLLLPVGLVILYLFFYRIDYVLLLITFCTRLAVNMHAGGPPGPAGPPVRQRYPALRIRCSC